MKKMLCVVSLVFSAVAATSVYSADVTVTGNRNYGGEDRNGVGVAVGQKVAGPVGVQLGFEKFTAGSNDQNRFSLLGTYDVAKLGPVNLVGKAGAAYLSNDQTKDGYAIVGGVGAEMPLTKSVAAIADWRYQRGQQRVEQFNGSTLGVGLKVSF
jgi:hypothetical protein